MQRRSAGDLPVVAVIGLLLVLLVSCSSGSSDGSVNATRAGGAFWTDPRSVALRFGRAIYGPNMADAAPYVRASDRNLMQAFINLQSRAGTVAHDLTASKAKVSGERSTVVLLGTFCTGPSVRNTGTELGGGLDGPAGAGGDSTTSQATTSQPAGSDGASCYKNTDPATDDGRFIITLDKDPTGRWKVVLSNAS